MKVGTVVTYTEGLDPKTQEPCEFNALVLGSRVVADHLGADDEPLLTLAFAKERTDPFGNPLPVHGTGQTSELVQIRLDVAHESHEYDADQKAKYQRQNYDGGRWREFSAPQALQVVDVELPVATSAPKAPETPITAESLGLTDSGEKKE